MSLPVIFHELAERELNEAAAYYANTRPGLGEAFLVEVQRAVDALAAKPAAARPGAGDIRWWRVRRFPYSVYYRIRESHIRILAIANQKRRPFYWRGRE
jgi:plasmid stabilization system protein ParE